MLSHGASPALAQDEAVRVIRNFAQRLDVAAVLGPIDGRRQLGVLPLRI